MREGGAENRPPDEGLSSAFDIQLLETLAALCSGNFDVRMGAGHSAIRGEIAHTLNVHLEQLGVFHVEMARVLHQTAVEGRLGAKAEVPGLSGAWRLLVDELNAASSILTDQIRSSTQVLKAYADGDLSERLSVPAQGEMLDLKDTINHLADNLVELKNAVSRLMEHHRAGNL